MSLSPVGATSSLRPADSERSLSQLAELARLIARHAPVDGVHETAIPGVTAIRMSCPSQEFVHALHQPAVCIIAQGAKRVMLRDEVYSYDASRFLVFSVDLPISAQITQASPDAPYLCFRLDLVPAEISALLLKRSAPPALRRGSSRGLYLSQVSDPMVDAATRLMRLLDTPDDAEALAPLAVQELVYRLLRSEQGDRLAHIAQVDSRAHRIAKVIAWLKTHFREPLRIEDLARTAHMSPSSLHHHFRTITAMSPLQYQKQLRLQEARRLLLGAASDVADASFRVGYESPSQFTREYSRLFGMPPSRDLQRLKQAVAA